MVGLRFKVPVLGKDKEPTTSLEGILRGVEPKEDGSYLDTYKEVGFENSNYEHILQPYKDENRGKEVLGTKAVVTNMERALREMIGYTSNTGNNDLEEEIDHTMKRLRTNLGKKYGSNRAEELLDDSNYMGGFWAETTHIHHRDIMAEMYDELLHAAVDTSDDMATEDSSLLYKAAIGMLEGKSQIESRKMTPSGGRLLDEEAKILLGNSQGYQLSSAVILDEHKDSGGNLKESFLEENGRDIEKLQVSSAITTDQQALQDPSKQDTNQIMGFNEKVRNMRNFLGRFEGMKINTSAVETSKEYLPLNQNFSIDSWDVHRQSKKDLGSKESKNLSILYDEDL